MLRRLFGGRGGAPPVRSGVPPEPVSSETSRQPTLFLGDEPLEVVGESNHQNALWRLAGRPRGSRVRVEIVAVLEPEPTNPVDRNAIRILIDDNPVGYLAREDARVYIAGLHSLISGCPTGCVGVRGVIAGGGQGDGRSGFLGVFLDHNPGDFGVQHHFTAMHGELRTGYSQARATDLADDSYDLSWGDTLSADDWTAAGQIEQLLQEERDPIDRHFMFAQLGKRLYRCRREHVDALERFDDACLRHDQEMDALRPILIAKFGAMPVVEMYHQAVIRCQKAKNWDQMRRWAQRAITIYGDEAARPDEFVDLHKRVAVATAKLETPERQKSRAPAQASYRPTLVEIETLVCVNCGSSFDRQRVRGRKPRHCPDCAQGR
jgi:hypothetical protein